MSSTYATFIGMNSLNGYLVAAPGLPGLVPTDQLIKKMRVSCAYYRKLSKHGAPSILVATYHCGTKLIREVLCFEHRGVVAQQAANWWSQRTNMPVPRTVDEALAAAVHLRVPIALRVMSKMINCKYPVICEYIFRTIN
jgi:hypothetical protein